MVPINKEAKGRKRLHKQTQERCFVTKPNKITVSENRNN